MIIVDTKNKIIISVTWKSKLKNLRLRDASRLSLTAEWEMDWSKKNPLLVVGGARVASEGETNWEILNFRFFSDVDRTRTDNWLIWREDSDSQLKT